MQILLTSWLLTVLVKTVSGSSFRVTPYHDTKGMAEWIFYQRSYCYEDAKAYCNDTGGRLLVLDSDFKRNHYQKHIRPSLPNWATKSMYLGARVLGGQSDYTVKWDTCEEAEDIQFRYSENSSPNGRCVLFWGPNAWQNRVRSHSEKCEDENSYPFVCEMVNDFNPCVMEHDFDSYLMHQNVSMEQDCSNMCVNIPKCWATLFYQNDCYLFKNTAMDTGSHAVMKRKNCAPTNASIVTDSSDETRCNLLPSPPSCGYQNDEESTVSAPYIAPSDPPLAPEVYTQTVTDFQTTTVSGSYAVYITEMVSMTVSYPCPESVTIAIDTCSSNLLPKTTTVTEYATISDSYPVYFSASDVNRDMVATLVTTTTEISTLTLTSTLLLTGACADAGTIVVTHSQIQKVTVPCSTNQPLLTNLTVSDVARKIEKLVKELEVEKNSTSQALRLKISVPDPRPSSQTIGAFAIIFTVAPFTVMVMSDCITVFRGVIGK